MFVSLMSLWRRGGWGVVVLVWAAGAVAASGDNAPERRGLGPAEKAAGFRLLFNGEDLTGWRPNGKPGSFSVKEGLLVADRSGDKRKAAYWLGTDREYGDFELRLQYKISPGGNSGIFIRAPHEGRTSKMGMEIQILDDHGRQGKPGAGQTGSIYRVVAPKTYAFKPAGQWNDLGILCDGDRVQVTLNDQVITDALMSDHAALKTRPRKGYIGLSAHTHPTWFRNVRLREIASPGGPGYVLKRDAYGVVVIAPDGRPVLGYVTKKRPNSKLTANSACCVHPVYTPAGEVVTSFAPDDHRHHRGVFLAWYALQGGEKKADFWGWGEYAPTENRVIVNRSVELKRADRDAAELRVRNDWLADGEAMIHEDLQIVVRKLEAAHVIDLTLSLHKIDVHVDG